MAVGIMGDGRCEAPSLAPRRIEIEVYGTPAPQGSKSFKGMRGGRAVLVEASKKVKPWRADVKAAAEAAMRALGASWEPMDGPLRLDVVFTLRKPLSAPKRTRTYPMRVPDLDKLLRSTDDALTDAGIWVDDARVVDCRALKAYPGEAEGALDFPGARIIVTEYRG